jgi:uncharacterized membrane protein YeaQ/YmgE (transglycosylase-associated protein family)
MLQCNRITLRRTDKGLTTAIVPCGPPLAGNQRRARVFSGSHEYIVRAVGRRIMVESLIAWLIVGAIAGWLAGLIVKGFGFGLIGNIVVGIIGAVIAGYLLPRLGIGLGVGMVAAIINAVIGAVVLLVIIGLVRRVS